MDVSIVVLAWEDADRTAACVRSLPAGAEVVVVDNGSGAGIAGALRDLCDATGARYVRSVTNGGYARGMNLGIGYCTRRYVVLSNNDLVVHAGAVEHLLHRLADPAVGAAFPRVLDAHGRDATAAGRFLTVPVGVAYATGLSMLLPRLRTQSPPERADWYSGPFVALRRETLADIGGVDESSDFYAEDLRLCWAVRRLGLGLAYVPGAVVTHEDDASARRRWSTREISRRQTREFVRASRHLHGWRGGVAGGAFALGTLVRAAVSPGGVRRSVARGAVEGMRAR